tara:strand:+ start:472 stop:744 length:273 start_codon:yes stop_codon:yes gene_type:complete
MSDKVWIDGLRVYKPNETSPDWVKAKITLNKAELMSWLANQQDETIKVQVAEAKSSGNYYAEVDTWKPNYEAMQTQESKPDGDFDDDIPF